VLNIFILQSDKDAKEARHNTSILVMLARIVPDILRHSMDDDAFKTHRDESEYHLQNDLTCDVILL